MLHWAKDDMLEGRWRRVAVLHVQMQEILGMGDKDRKSRFLYPPVLLRSGQTCYEIDYVTD